MKSSSGSKEYSKEFDSLINTLVKKVRGPAPRAIRFKKQARGPVPVTSNSNKLAWGFTLIEIMITIAIIGMMTAIIVSYLGAAKSRGRDAKRIADLKQIEQGLEVYFSSCNSYPPNLGGLLIDCNGNSILSSVPNDPLNVPYPYAMATEPTLQYHVCAVLELGYAGGIGKAGHPPIAGAIPEDQCEGEKSNIFDKYGP